MISSSLFDLLSKYKNNNWCKKYRNWLMYVRASYEKLNSGQLNTAHRHLAKLLFLFFGKEKIASTKELVLGESVN